MGLYLCVFDNNDDELDGLEIGSYEDFNHFRDAVTSTVEKGQLGSVCPVLINHSDCDGLWTPVEAAALRDELTIVEKVFSEYPPVEFNASWKAEVAKTFGLKPTTLLDCFFDVDGEPLVERLKNMASLSVKRQLPIRFQ